MKAFISVKILHVFLHSDTSPKRSCKRIQQLKTTMSFLKKPSPFRRKNLSPWVLSLGGCGPEEELASQLPVWLRRLWGLEPAWEGPREPVGLGPPAPARGALATLFHLCLSSSLTEDRARCSSQPPPASSGKAERAAFITRMMNLLNMRIWAPGWRCHVFSSVVSLETTRPPLVYLCSPRASQVPGAAAVIASSPVRCGWRETRTA